MLQWAADDGSVPWTARFPDDAYPPAVHAILHLELGEAGKRSAVGALPPPDTTALPVPLLYRCLDTTEGITFTLLASRAPGETELALGTLQAGTDAWQRSALTAPEGTPDAPWTSLRVEASGRGTLALGVLGREAAPTEPLLAALASVYQGQGKTLAAELTWRQLEAETADPVMRAKAQAHLADCLLASGKPQEAAAGYLALWSALGTRDPLAAPDAPPQGYHSARATVDLAPYLSRRLGEACAALDTAADPAMLRVAAEGWPLGEVGCRAALRLAEIALAEGRPDEACGLALRALHRYPDAGPPRTALLPENAAYLAAANYLPDPELLKSALSLAIGATAPPEGLAQMATEWLALEQAADSRDPLFPMGDEEGVPDLPGSLHVMADLRRAQVLLRLGHARKAMAIADRWRQELPERSALASYAHYLCGAAEAMRGAYGPAAAAFGVAADANDAWLAGLARLEGAECLEFGGRTFEAREAYAELAQGARLGTRWSRLRAIAAIRRVPDDAGSAAEPGAGAAAVYLGEERQTQGDWYRHYGSEAFLLCGHYSPEDCRGGPLADAFVVTKRTGRADDPARSWVTAGSGTDPSILYSPIDDVRRPANWDDHGEAYPAGAGPDLILTCRVPPGVHRLSLYFVNDHAYYEPNRDYTVQILDEEGRVHAATEVRYFLSGVYKLFGVCGPQALTIRIHRNASLNVVLAGLFLDRLTPAGSDVEGDLQALGIGATPRSSPRAYLVEIASFVTARNAPPSGTTDLIGAQRLAWQRDELIHQDPWSEAGRLACLIDAVEYRKGAEAAPTFAMDCATRAVDEGRTWAAIWAAEALCDRVTDAPVSEESRALLERAALLFLRPRRVGCWGPTDLQRPVCAPVARALLDRLLGTFPDGTARTAFCRSFASRHGLMDQPLVAQALRDIIDREGAEALTDDELNLYVTCSGDAPGDIALLEARVNAEGPLACDLRFWQALVSLYCEQKQYEKLARTADGLAALATDREGCAQLMLACARSLGAAQLGNEALEVIRELTRTLPETTAAQAARELRAELGRGD